MKVPTSSARYFRASIRSSAAAAERPPGGSIASRPAARPPGSPDAHASGRDGEDLGIRSELHRDEAVRAVDAIHVESVEGQLRLTPGAFDRDHARRLPAVRDS